MTRPSYATSGGSASAGKPFAFRLERLLDVRRLREDLASRDLGLARRAVDEENRLILGLLDEVERAREARRGHFEPAPPGAACTERSAAERRGVEVDILQVRLHQDYQASVERRLEEETRRLEDLVRAEADCRRALVDARKGVRVLERFRERRLREHAREDGRREQREIDEAARTAPEPT